MQVKQRLWELLEVAEDDDRGSRAFDAFLLTLIFLNAVAVVVGTVGAVERQAGVFLEWFENVSIAVFTLEYLGRLWSCTADPRFSRPLLGRLRFAGTPLAVIDLLAVLPFYLPFVGVDLRFLRVLRLMRIFRLAKLARYVRALHLLGRVLRARKEELLLTLGALLLVLVIASSLMYYVESAVQPEAFPDIPSTMWWAVATLTTVGYGDVFPVTALGRMLGAVVAVLGIGLFAVPTAIIGAGFVEELEKERGGRRCPHCGMPVDG
jgi:voltage-gated potassium channel